MVNFRNGKGHEQYITEVGKYVVVNSKFISSNRKVKKYSNNILSPLYEGDLVMVMSDVPNGKAIAKFDIIDKNDKYTLNQRVGAFSTLQDNKYLFYKLNRNKYFLSFDDGVKQTNLKKEDILTFNFLLPDLQEQKRISNLLSEIDILINEKEMEINLLRMSKKYFLKNLSYQEKKESLKFLGHEFENNLCKLRAVGKFISGLTYSPNNINGDGILVLRSSNIMNNKLSLIDRVYVDKFQYPKYKQIEKNDILICVRNGSKSLIGKNILIDEELFNTTHGAFMSVLRSKNNKFNSILFETYQYQKQVDTCLGATINQLTNKDLENFKFNYPSIEIQEKIIFMISKQSKQIDYLNNELVNLIQIKSFLLKKMLV